jgi:uncharacterized RDD family membrane protein YckC
MSVHAPNSGLSRRSELLRPASIVARVLAWLIDSLVMLPLVATIWLNVDPTLVLVAAQFWFLVYSAVGWSRIAGGQTIGMRVVNIHVVRLDGSGMGLARGVMRYLALLLSFLLLGLPLLLVAATKDRQALHDVLTGTIVVATEPAALDAGARP